MKISLTTVQNPQNRAQGTEENSVLLTYLMNEINNFQVNKKSPMRKPLEIIAHAYTFQKFSYRSIT